MSRRPTQSLSGWHQETNRHMSKARKKPFSEQWLGLAQHGLAHRLCLLALLTLGLWGSEPLRANDEGIDFFERQVRPLLVKHCYECHSAQTAEPKGGLLLDTRAGWMTGGDSGPAVVPHDLQKSLLLQAVRYETYEMPPRGKLSDAEIGVLEKWVSLGAPDPRDGTATRPTQPKFDLAEARTFWSFQLPRRHTPPQVTQVAWARDELDRFILAELEKRNLHPSDDAEPRVWLRRVTYDLTGLAPTADELAEFEADASDEARVRIVERLLERPQFGEHWARHWLDVARYADSNGNDFNATFHEAWRYRNYVIQAFNRDEPFDRFVQAQLAGDLLPADSIEQSAEQIIATGFLMLGTKMLSERDKARLEMDVVDEQIDTMGRAFLGMTLGCARCHDHKFDPIPTRDYYALAGIFRSTKVLEGEIQQYVSDWVQRDLPIEPALAEKLAQHQQRLTSVQEKLKAAQTTQAAAEKQLASLQSTADWFIDDAAAEKVGNWTSSTFTPKFLGSGYLHDEDRDKGSKSVIFSLPIQRAAKYEIQYAYSSGKNRADKVPITLSTATGEVPHFIDQRIAPPIDATYVSLGTFDLAPDQTNRLIVSTTGSMGHVIVDGIRLIELGADGKPVKREPDEGRKAEIAATTQALELARKEVELVQKEIKELEAQGPRKPKALAVVENTQIGDCELCVRGDHRVRGPRIERGFLQVANYQPTPTFSPTESGRRQLAEWVASRDNPLTARVIVNRVWAHLFGEGLVRSVDNFGLLGDRPTHPELLDQLAIDLMDDQWSLKRLIRRMVLSRTYAQSSQHDPIRWQVDPENRYLWRAHRRMLPAEAIRDSLLTASQQLDLSPGQSPVANLAKLVTTNGPNSESYKRQDSFRRSLYMPIVRNELPTILTVFDFADPDLSTGKRNTTNVPAQALLLMNSPFVMDCAQRTAEQIGAELSVEQRIDLLYRTILNRPASLSEIERAVGFLWRAQAIARSEAATQNRLEQTKSRANEATPPGETPTANSANSSPMDRAGGPAVASADAASRAGDEPETPRLDVPPGSLTSSAATVPVEAWAQFVQVLFASTEFRMLD